MADAYGCARRNGDPRRKRGAGAIRERGVNRRCCWYILTVCPSNDSASMLSYQELPTSIQLWRGHGQEAKRGEAGRHRITRNLKRLGRLASRVRPPGCPCSLCGARAV